MWPVGLCGSVCVCVLACAYTYDHRGNGGLT